MAVNVTYLLGAGASYDIVPLVKEVKDEDGEVIKKSLGNDILEIAQKFKRLKETRGSALTSLKILIT